MISCMNLTKKQKFRCWVICNQSWIAEEICRFIYVVASNVEPLPVCTIFISQWAHLMLEHSYFRVCICCCFQGKITLVCLLSSVTDSLIMAFQGLQMNLECQNLCSAHAWTCQSRRTMNLCISRVELDRRTSQYLQHEVMSCNYRSDSSSMYTILSWIISIRNVIWNSLLLSIPFIMTWQCPGLCS